MAKALRTVRLEWRETSRHKLPPINHAYRAAIRRFLDKMMDQVEKNLATHRAILAHTPDDRTRGLVQYLTNYRSALRDLKAINESRRGHGELR